MNDLQKSLGANAIFSGMCGLTLIAFHKSTANLFGLKDSTAFWITGIALIFFVFTLILEIVKRRPIPVLWIIIQDTLWVTGSIILLVYLPFGISNTGNIIIAVVALIVALIAFYQASALSQIDALSTSGNKLFRFERRVNASKQNVWKVISDVSSYHQVAPNVDDVKIISGEGEGMVRKCSHGKDSWTETCSTWVEERTYSFEVNTSAPDYPYPLKYLKGTWEVNEINNDKTKVIMFFEFTYKYKIYNVVLHPLLRDAFKKTAEELLNNWQNILEKK